MLKGQGEEEGRENGAKGGGQRVALGPYIQFFSLSNPEVHGNLCAWIETIIHPSDAAADQRKPAEDTAVEVFLCCVVVEVRWPATPPVPPVLNVHKEYILFRIINQLRLHHVLDRGNSSILV